MHKSRSSGVTVSRKCPWCFITVILLNSININGSSPMNRLDFLSGCTCPGYGIAYTCTVCGAETTTTVWEGTAFQCHETSNEIALRHSQFTDQDSPESGDCSGGSLIAYATGKEQNCYISQLNATVSADLNGSTIECSFEARGMNGFQTVNRSTVSITTEPPPPPINVRLRNVSQGQLFFTWTPGVQLCEAVHYVINSTNCGICPNITNSTYALCSALDLTSNERVCSLGVKTVVCDDLVGENSQNIQVITKVPNSPTNVQVIPTFHYNSNKLIKLNISFSDDMSSYNISNGISGSAVSYNITFEKDSSMCDFVVIPPSFCENQACNGVVLNSSSPCLPSNEIKVSAYATNLLGSGPISSPVTIDTLHQIVRVQIHHESSIVSILCNISSLVMKSVNATCGVLYGPVGSSCISNVNSANATRFEEDIATIVLNPIQRNITYCFVITITSSGSVVAIIEGTLSSNNIIMSGSSTGMLIGIIAGSISGFLMIAAIVVVSVLFVFYLKKHKSSASSMNDEKVVQSTGGDSQEVDLCLTFITDSGETKIDLLNDKRFEETNVDDFAVHGVKCTCTIKTFMKDICGHETYRSFIGNTYYEFVQEEQLSDRREVILMHNVPRGEKVSHKIFRAYLKDIPLRTNGGMKKPPRIKEPGWRVFLRSFDGKKFIYRNRSQLPDKSKENLDPEDDINEQLMFIVDKSL